MGSSTKKKNSVPILTGNHSMSWKELAEADDLASSLTIDSYLGFTTHKMTDMKLRIPERLRSKFRDIMTEFRKHKCYETTYDQLTSDSNIVKKFWRLDPRFRLHVYRYLLLFDDRSGIEIRPCWRYASENHIGGAIYATENWPKGSRIHTLIGCIAEMNRSEELAFLKHKKNDFSVMYSSRKNCSQLWLGPAAYVNHDCQPNCEFTINCDADARMSLEVKTDIKKGDEIFIYYGPHFFEANNRACECFTCELLGRGYFSSTRPVNAEFLNSGDEPNPSSTELHQVSVEQHACMFADGTSRNEPNAIDPPTNASNILRDRLNDSIVDAHSSLSGLLPKGSSTGAASRSLSTAYSLRHTGSRLDRIKARIYANALKATKESDNQENKFNFSCASLQVNNSIHNSMAPVKRIKRESLPLSLTVRPRRSMRLRSSNLQTDAFNRDAQSYALSETSSDTMHVDANVNVQSLDSNMVNDTCIVLSPLPPHLDRISSMDSQSLHSTVSTAADTPDILPAYYHTFSDPSLDITLSNYLQSSSEPISMSDRSMDRSSHTSATSPACIVEPILNRLINEVQTSPKKSFTFQSCGSAEKQLKQQSKKLTNYDARLIAETEVLPPGHRRAPSTNHSLLSSTSHKSTKLIMHTKQKLIGVPKCRLRNDTKRKRLSIRSYPFPCTDQYSGNKGASSDRSRSPISFHTSSVPSSFSDWSSGMSNLSSYPLELHSKQCNNNNIGDPRIFSPVANNLSSNKFSKLEGEIMPDISLTPLSICSSQDSSATTPLRLDDQCSENPTRLKSTLQSDYHPPIISETIARLRNDHDYTRTSPHLSFSATPSNSANSSVITTPIQRNSSASNSPQPPLLHPVTPPSYTIAKTPLSFLHSDKPISRPHQSISRSSLVYPSHDHSINVNGGLCTFTQSSLKVITPSKPLVPVDNRHILPRSSLHGRLTVTIKRVGPKDYRISQHAEGFLLSS